MVGAVLRRRKSLIPPVSRTQIVGLAIAALATAGVLVAVFTDLVPFIAIVAVGFIAMALLVIGDLRDGDHMPESQSTTHEPQIASVKQNPKPPAQRL
jgi:hypothetical protein